MVLPWWDFHREFSSYSRRVARTMFQVFGASVVMGFVSYELLNVLDGVFNIDTTLGIFFQGFLAGLIGIGVGITVLLLLKNEELPEIWHTLHRKIFKAKVVGPDATMD